MGILCGCTGCTLITISKQKSMFCRNDAWISGKLKQHSMFSRNDARMSGKLKQHSMSYKSIA